MQLDAGGQINQTEKKRESYCDKEHREPRAALEKFRQFRIH
jgi:hypothetical protein